MRNISKTVFIAWIEKLHDANPEPLLKWFGDGKTADEVFNHLKKEWDVDEVAEAFFRI